MPNQKKIPKKVSNKQMTMFNMVLRNLAKICDNVWHNNEKKPCQNIFITYAIGLDIFFHTKCCAKVNLSRFLAYFHNKLSYQFETFLLVSPFNGSICFHL